jgi:hypothetical protein
MFVEKVEECRFVSFPGKASGVVRVADKAIVSHTK